MPEFIENPKCEPNKGNMTAKDAPDNILFAMEDALPLPEQKRLFQEMSEIVVVITEAVLFKVAPPDGPARVKQALDRMELCSAQFVARRKAAETNVEGINE